MGNKFSRDRVQGFLHADGRRMVNGNGETVVLRGWGAGNWANPEGFMIGIQRGFGGGMELGKFSLPGRMDRGRALDAAVKELCGSEYAAGFWGRWTRNHLGEGDIRTMAEMGYNSVRLPVTSWLFLPEEPEIRFNEDSFEMLNQILDWCEKYRIYAILDMHGAPGGQSALPCDDGIDNVPHLFLEPESRERAMILWEEFARRFKDRWIIGAYDLLNEPLSGPGWDHLKPELMSFYDEVIARIRKIDKNHMFTIEGSDFSMDMQIFDHEYDPECHNWCIHSHFYGFSPEPRDLYYFLDSSIRCNVPVWIGEGGSDPVSNSIYYEIAAAYDIGYALWSWKAADGPGGMGGGGVFYNLPEGWDKIQEYASKGGARPSYKEAQQIMDEYLENLKFENCRVNWDAAPYNTRRPGITLPAVGFDYDPEPGVASNGTWRHGNSFAYRTEEQVKLVLKAGAKPQHKTVLPSMGPGRGKKASPLTELWVELETGKFVTYTIRDVKEECEVILSARGFGPEGGNLLVTAGEQQDIWMLPASEELQTQTVLTLPGCAEGCDYIVKVEAQSGCVQLAEISFK